MCGIAGFIDGSGRIKDIPAAMAILSRAIRHRGPDGEADSYDSTQRVALVHRRLAVQDPSENGAQPMKSANGRFEIVYNGEIYDFPERRSELEAAGRRFRTGTDTEVLLAGFEQWGIEATLDRIDGMFAFAVHDRKRCEMVLARDRAGQKPLLVATAGGCVAFSSDLRALEALPEPFAGRLRGIDETSLDWFLRLGVVPWPRSIRPGVEHVPPGGLFRIEIPSGRIHRNRWWNPPSMEETDDDLRPPEPIEAPDRSTLEVLRESVHRRCRADRPVGCFLSGGIDSRIVAALAAEKVPNLPCFTLALPEPFDESSEAAKIAAGLGARHHVIRPTAGDIEDTAIRLPGIADEPFADSSLVATTLLASAARSEIVVALGGDGGDELFGGYRRHVAVARRGNLRSRFEGALGRGIGMLPEAVTGRIRLGRHALGELAARRGMISRRHVDYLGLRQLQGNAKGLLRPRPGDPNAFERARLLSEASFDRTAPWDGLPIRPNDVRSLMAADFRTYLPDDPLRKVDAGTMAVALELRSPFLGREVIDHAFGLPTKILFDRFGGRAPIRRCLRTMGMSERARKKGFAVPIHDWLRGPLRDRAASLLLDPAEDPLSPGGVADLFHGVQAGRRDLATACWTVFCWRAWLHGRDHLR